MKNFQFFPENTPKCVRREKKFHFFSLLTHTPKQQRVFDLAEKRNINEKFQNFAQRANMQILAA